MGHKTKYVFEDKDVTTWTALDFKHFYDNVESIAADGDLAAKRPELREMALGIIERKGVLV